MPHQITPEHTRSHHTTPHQNTPDHTVSCHTTPYHATPDHTMPHQITLHHTMPHHATPDRATSHHATQDHITQRYTSQMALQPDGTTLSQQMAELTKAVDQGGSCQVEGRPMSCQFQSTQRKQTTHAYMHTHVTFNPVRFTISCMHALAPQVPYTLVHTIPTCRYPPMSNLPLPC